MFQVLKPTARALFGALILLCLPLAGAHASETILNNFSTSYTNGAYPVGQLVLSGGAFYGVSQFGVNGNGDIFKMTATGVVTVLHEFNGADGNSPNAGMVLVGNTLYGTTLTGGGSGNTGVLFRIGTNGSGFTVLHAFTGYNSSNPPASDGAYIYAGLLLASDGNLYGTTGQGGSNNQGTVFMFNPSTGSYAVIHPFNSATDTAYGPYTALAEGTNGFLYGTTYYATGYNGGLYKIKKDGTGYVFLHGFNTSDPAGYYPESDLMTASDGNLYGVCQNGGINGLGTVFKVVPSTGAVSALWAFDGTTGAYPGWYNVSNTQVRLIQGSDHNLYGVSQYFGFYGYGTAFKLTLSGACSVLTNFNYNTMGTVNPLVQSGTNFFCTSFWGGSFALPGSFNGAGAALSISATGVIKLLQTFYQRDAWNPYAGLVQDGTKFYGECFNGGEFGNGFIYSVDAAGHFTIVHQLNDNNYYQEGRGPAGGLLLNGTSFYGMTSTGGKYGGGTLFKMSTKGVITILYDMDLNREGFGPYSALTKGAGTDANLYGTLSNDSQRGYGCVFSTDVTGKKFKVIHYFNISDGVVPECTPVPDANGNLWGTCESGGAHGLGTIWKLSTDGSTFTKAYDFDGTHGSYGYYDGHLYLINGILYGTAQTGGANGHGVLWAFNTASSTISLLHSFNNNTGFKEGYYPVGLSYDPTGGNFYGCCNGGGAHDVGTVWKVNISSGAFTKLYDFAGYNSSNPPASDGAYPYYAPILGTDGLLYGTTVYGGTTNNGTAFQATP